ncbi:MAG: nucleotidyltransferase domain-containing protein [Endomicrobium sp.]|jgi:predicted nucleotidyltransferase|nr:nucleotidyltransferase domain-containing protein [Endomicrobium sp.]
MEINSILNKIVESLKPVDPYKIILFGSHARGTAKSDSDIDLLIILDSDLVVKNSDERIRRNCAVKINVKYVYPMDLVVQSRAEYMLNKERGSFFIYEVEKAGKTIYEKYN